MGPDRAVEYYTLDSHNDWLVFILTEDPLMPVYGLERDLNNNEFHVMPGS